MILKTPLKIKEQGGFAEVIEADGNPIPFLTDIELGWTDTSTGNYHAPEDDLAILKEIVKCVNAHEPFRKTIMGLSKELARHKPEPSTQKRGKDWY